MKRNDELTRKWVNQTLNLIFEAHTKATGGGRYFPKDWIALIPEKSEHYSSLYQIQRAALSLVEECLEAEAKESGKEFIKYNVLRGLAEKENKANQPTEENT